MNGGTPLLPRELILASAGTGKTFRISKRIIGLLAAGAPADAIFASTFTRKAAGEILDRVLEDLAKAALDPSEGVKLAGHARLPGFAELDPAPETWLALLGDIVRDLHRVNIGTLDSFFVRTARSFADEIGLPPGWSIADAPLMERVRADALQEVLSSADTGALVELVREVSGSGAGRSVHAGLLARARDLLDLYHSLDPNADDPWAGLEPSLGAPPPGLEGAGERLAAELEAAGAPPTRSGAPHQGWANALGKVADQLRAGDWEAVVCSTLCGKCRTDAPFHGIPVPPRIRAVFDEACGIARWVVGRRLVVQGRAMGRLATLLATAVEARQSRTGAYDFTDLTRMIGGPDPVTDRPDLYFRLDARARHILLDEFQDTSLAQWEALEPLLEEIAAGYADERAAVIVADPKQSIYAWRGGEPRLVRRVGRQYGLKPDELHVSWRSSAVVLEAVNRIFADLPANPVFGDDQGARAVAAEWSEDFREHESAKKELSGHVRVVVGPADEGKGSDRPLLCRRAAELVGELRAAAPGRSIGVLARRNQTVARLMMELGRLDVPASEEGGNPLTDSKAVASVLALLRLADHPGDLVSRYHVAKTPVGGAAGFTDFRDDRAANRLAHDTRRRLVADGYGQTLAKLAKRLRPHCSQRERRRLDQLVELAFRYDDRATLRVSDFVRLVEAERVEDPTSADVRVMTVHQAKGLEFDVVVLPELDFDLERAVPAPFAYRPLRAGRVARAFPYVPTGIRDLFADVPELEAAIEDARAGRLRDGLSGLYVALTRARQALHIVVKPDGSKGMGEGCTSATLLRHALGAAGPAAEGDVLYEIGDPGWYLRPVPDAPAGDMAGAAARLTRADRPVTSEDRPEPTRTVRLREGGARSRGFARTAPSQLAAGSRVDPRMILNLEAGAALEGTIVHAWFEMIGWIEDGTPDPDALRAAARAIDPRIAAERLDGLIERWNGWLADAEIRRAVSRAGFPEGATTEREVRFIHRDADAVLEGAIDRLVLLRDDGRVTGAVILDYKTDRIERGDAAALAEKADRYRPQLDAYSRAVAGWYGITPAEVACRLVVLEAGAVVEV